jgi:hypothetical protein
MSAPRFTFVDPTGALVRLLLLGPLLVDANEDNLSFFPRHGSYYEDYADGARLRRIQEKLPEGAATLTSVVLFFDEINLDQKGYISGDGILLMAAFLKRQVRESLLVLILT